MGVKGGKKREGGRERKSKIILVVINLMTTLCNDL